MRRGSIRKTLFGATVALILLTSLSGAQAIHFYRNDGGGCSPAEGALTDDAPDTTPTGATTVVVGHNAFTEGISGFDAGSLVAPIETTIKTGEAITWTWNSAHCHSVTSRLVAEDTTALFDSGFHYPTTPPDSPQAIPGFFDYPLLDEDPPLTYTHTFTTAGTFEYYCVHHESIGMRGIVIVED